MILVGGEAGMGKTTLVEDLSIQAEEVGCLVLWGHAYDLSVTPPRSLARDLHSIPNTWGRLAAAPGLRRQRGGD